MSIIFKVGLNNHKHKSITNNLHQYYFGCTKYIFTFRSYNIIPTLCFRWKMMTIDVLKLMIVPIALGVQSNYIPFRLKFVFKDLEVTRRPTLFTHICMSLCM